MAGLLLTDNLSELEEEVEEDILTFLDWTDTETQMQSYCWCWHGGYWTLWTICLEDLFVLQQIELDIFEESKGYTKTLYWVIFIIFFLMKNKIFHNIIWKTSISFFSPLEIILLRHIGLRRGKLELGLMDWLSGLKPNIMNNQYSSNGYYELSKGYTF